MNLTHSSAAHASSAQPSQPAPFYLERYFAKHEFTVPNGLLSCSDVQALSLKELLAMADAECKDLYDNLVLSYTESQGHPKLRAEIAKIYHENAACTSYSSSKAFEFVIIT